MIRHNTSIPLRTFIRRSSRQPIALGTLWECFWVAKEDQHIVFSLGLDNLTKGKSQFMNKILKTDFAISDPV